MLRAVADGVLIAVRVQPRASRSEIAGVAHGALRIRLTAPPVEGAANEALVSLLAGQCGVARSRIEIRSGDRGRNKTVLIKGLGIEQAATRLGISAPTPTGPRRASGR
ncbi:MAG TPA: DUF167 domain-containing protein [Gemmatimonadales bacterium]|nr:DUF167 domain-containing protein [Gemmatimonadales bacterium]